MVRLPPSLPSSRARPPVPFALLFFSHTPPSLPPRPPRTAVPIRYRSTVVENVWFKAMGAQLSFFGSSVSWFIRSGLASQPDMMIIGEGCFGAGGPCIPSCLVETDESDGSTWVTFYETVMKKDSYLGHACLVLPGTVLEEGAAAADFCTTPPHFRVKRETAVIGAAADLRTVAHRSAKKTARAPAAAATGAFDFIYRYISCESCSQCDSLPLIIR